MSKHIPHTIRLLRQVVMAMLLSLCFVEVYAQALLPMGEGSLYLSRKRIRVFVDDRADAPLEFLQADVFSDRRIRFVSRRGRVDVLLEYASDCLPEAYHLTVTPQHIAIEAADKAGFVYALQTLRQWAQLDGTDAWVYPCIAVDDRPQMAWRGFMLDSGRQFHSVGTIKKYIDMASMLKMNVFHCTLPRDSVGVSR